MPINKEKQPISMTKKTGKQKKILKPSSASHVQRTSKSTGKKQIISKSKGQNIQIHIDLSKKRSGSKARQEVISHKKDTQPTINLPPPVYGLQPQTNYDNSMFQALNKIMEQNKQFEEALKGEKKKENIFTGREEPVRTPSLGDIINKNTPLRKGDDVSTLYTLESEEPEIEERSVRSTRSTTTSTEPEIEERSVRSTRSTTTRTEPEIEEQKEPTGTETLQQLYGTQLEGGGGGGGRGRRRKEREEIDIGKIEVGQITTKMLNDMKLEELQALAGIKFNIFPYYSAYKRNGQSYNKAKTKEELRREINEARLQKIRK